ncbi:MAG TPA: response regulator transcription factor [Polyangiaceae bacterium]|nr:response regulator transcription factor [Polyangiaceae bacterium]
MGTQGSASGRLRASPVPPSQGTGARELAGARYRVLVIDDDEPLVRQWQRLLKDDAVLISVPTYGGGWARTDRETWRSDPCDHVFLDLRLPDGDGADLLPRIHELDPKPSVAVITGLLDAQRTLELRNRCAIAIPKPADRDVLRGILAILERDRRGGSAVREFAAIYRLSNQETRLLDAAVQELTNEQAAQVLGCAHSTVRSYWSRIFEKIGCHSERDVVARLLRYAQESNARSSQTEVVNG